MHFNFSFGKWYEIQSIKISLFDSVNTSLYSKSYKIRLICTNLKSTIKITSWHCWICYYRAPKFNNCPRNAWIVIIVVLCTESLFVKYMLGFWLQMKFDEIFWGELDIDVLKGGGMQAKVKWLYYFLAFKWLKQQVVITNEKINIPIFVDLAF